MEKRSFEGDFRMKKLLITGFAPFGGEEINPSWEAVLRLPETLGEYELCKLCLPVVFGEAAELAIAEAEKISADAVLSIGQAGGRAAVTPELVGINLRHAKIPDNKGNQPRDEAIIPGGAAAYFSTLPVRKMAEAIRAAGLPSELSYSAGAYVCNELLYSLLARFDTENKDRKEGEKHKKTRAAFIHVPYIPEQGKEPNLSLDNIVNALIVAIENLDQ